MVVVGNNVGVVIGWSFSFCEERERERSTEAKHREATRKAEKKLNR